MTRIIGIEWKKSESNQVYYKNYKSWGWNSSAPKLYIKFQDLDNGTVIEKNVYNFILKRLGWKRITEKRISEFKEMFMNKIVNHEIFVAN